LKIAKTEQYAKMVSGLLILHGRTHCAPDSGELLPHDLTLHHLTLSRWRGVLRRHCTVADPKV